MEGAVRRHAPPKTAMLRQPPRAVRPRRPRLIAVRVGYTPAQPASSPLTSMQEAAARARAAAEGAQGDGMRASLPAGVEREAASCAPLCQTGEGGNDDPKNRLGWDDRCGLVDHGHGEGRGTPAEAPRYGDSADAPGQVEASGTSAQVPAAAAARPHLSSREPSHEGLPAAPTSRIGVSLTTKT